MAETWRGIYPITSFVLDALRRKRDAERDAALSAPEQVLLDATEFWAAAAHGTLEEYLASEPLARLRAGQQAFAAIGAVRVVSLVRVAAEALAAGASAASVIAQLDERLARTDDNVDDLIARYAGGDVDGASPQALSL